MQVCTSELIITDLLLSIDIQLMQSVEFRHDSLSAEIVNKVSLIRPSLLKESRMITSDTDPQCTTTVA